MSIGTPTATKRAYLLVLPLFTSDVGSGAAGGCIGVGSGSGWYIPDGAGGYRLPGWGIYGVLGSLTPEDCCW